VAGNPDEDELDREAARLRGNTAPHATQRFGRLRPGTRQRDLIGSRRFFGRRSLFFLNSARFKLMSSVGQLAEPNTQLRPNQRPTRNGKRSPNAKARRMPNERPKQEKLAKETACGRNYSPRRPPKKRDKQQSRGRWARQDWKPKHGWFARERIEKLKKAGASPPQSSAARDAESGGTFDKITSGRRDGSTLGSLSVAAQPRRSHQARTVRRVRSKFHCLSEIKKY